MGEERPYRRRPRRTLASSAHKSSENKSGFHLLLVQSISCLVVILVVLIIKLAGGSAFAQLRQSFNKAVMDNTFTATLAALFQPDESVSAPSDDTAATTAASDKTSDTESTTNVTATTVPETDVSSSAGATGSAAVGGQDVPMGAVKILYAPEGATFAPLSCNQRAAAPLAEAVFTSGFGYRQHPTKGGDSFHLGTDLAADAGTPIAAMFFGVVIEVGKSDSLGNYLRLYHGGGMEVLYAHCSEILVQKDVVVKAGETVAKVGSTGDSTGDHLHVEVKVDGVSYDPAYILPMEKYE